MEEKVFLEKYFLCVFEKIVYKKTPLPFMNRFIHN